MEENWALDGTLNYSGDSARITWMVIYLVTFKLGHRYKNTPLGEGVSGNPALILW